MNDDPRSDTELPDETAPGEPTPNQDELAPRTYDDPGDDASDDSFPASDPPSWTDSTASRNPDTASG